MGPGIGNVHLMKFRRGVSAAWLFCAMLSAHSLHGQSAPRDTTRTDVLRVGDVIKLWIWREEDLSGDFPVPETGFVVFPKIGSWKVIDRNTVDLKTALLAEYQKYLRNPSIEITFLKRVNILGAVKEPGVYPLDGTMTISNAIARAGGIRPEGKADEVQLIRGDQKLVAKISQRTRIADLPIQSGDQLYVPERGWAERNTGVIAALISGLVSVAVTILVNK
jgi:protein involved in polysaccharide export with SLBB domain